MPIRLQVLGGLHAFRDDVPLAWVPAQHVSSALLVYLALERDVTREQLARLFWPDEELAGARHALRQALYRLRHAAGEGLIEDAGDVLRLAVPVACDALDLERVVEAGDPGAAMALYGGAFLKDVSLSASREFEAWTDRQRARFRLHRRACRARIEAWLPAVAEAIEAARAWVTLEPFDDEAQHRLIELLAGSGQRTEALAQYERYERLLEGPELEPLQASAATSLALSWYIRSDMMNHDRDPGPPARRPRSAQVPLGAPKHNHHVSDRGGRETGRAEGRRAT
jgi:DNA-binding SARP family transcriptional activator